MRPFCGLRVRNMNPSLTGLRMDQPKCCTVYFVIWPAEPKFSHFPLVVSNLCIIFMTNQKNHPQFGSVSGSAHHKFDIVPNLAQVYH